MSLQAKVAAVLAATTPETRPSRDELSTMVVRMISEEEKARPLTVGDSAPGFTLRTSDGVLVSAETLLRSGPLVVTFYRGLWCPYCQSDLRGFDAAMPDIKSLGAAVLAISHARRADFGAPLEHGLHLDFPVLEDVSGDVAVRFGIRWSSEDTQFIEETLGLSSSTFRGTDPWIVPMQARFVIDVNSRIAFAEAAFTYDQRTDPAGVIPLLAQLRTQG